ncbi:MAG: hypothetical protein LC689_02325 [Myxococcales bacterium]|nr:hypothetical protein [Myxococcales bacterium]
MAVGPFHEAWYVVASDPRSEHGLWLRYTADVNGDRTFAVWGAWFSPQGSFAVRNIVDPAAIGRTALSEQSCSGEVEAGGHSLRWRLGFGQGAPGEEFIPGWLRPVAGLRGSGYTLLHPATTVTGAVEVDGRMIELQRVPAGQAHLWGKTRYPAWAWARCNGFAEDPEASIDLVDVEGPGGVRVPIFVFRFRGEVHRFAELPWIALCASKPSAPSWHFSAQDSRLAIDGVVRVDPSRMVQVRYDAAHHCANSEIASMEVRVRSRAMPGASWRPEATLTAKSGACLEFCGRQPDARVLNSLATAVGISRQKEAAVDGSVAS